MVIIYFLKIIYMQNKCNKNEKLYKLIFCYTHQSVPPLPTFPTPDIASDKVSNVEPIPASNTQNDIKSKRTLEYDHYFTYENKIYSFFTDHSGEEIDSLLCNFAVYPFCIECVFEKDGSQTKNLKLLVVCGVNQCEISIRPECTDKLLKEIQKHIPQAYINPGVKRGNMVLSAYLSMMLENCA